MISVQFPLSRILHSWTNSITTHIVKKFQIYLCKKRPKKHDDFFHLLYIFVLIFFFFFFFFHVLKKIKIIIFSIRLILPYFLICLFSFCLISTAFFFIQKQIKISLTATTIHIKFLRQTIHNCELPRMSFAKTGTKTTTISASVTLPVWLMVIIQPSTSAFKLWAPVGVKPILPQKTVCEPMAITIVRWHSISYSGTPYNDTKHYYFTNITISTNVTKHYYYV